MNARLPDLPLLLAEVPACLRRALEQEGVPTADYRSGRAGKFVFFDSRRFRPGLSDGQIGIDIDFLRSSRSRDPLEALADERAACHEWQIGRLAVRDQVARVHHASVRRRIVDDLRLHVEAAGGIWLRMSPFPRPYQSAFNFRFDHDEYDARDFDATLGAIAGHEHAVSHYVCAATHARFPEALARLGDAHVGSHGWWHHTYRDALDNLKNIRRGIDSLRDLGLDPVGFAAPHGRFNSGLLAALEQLEVTHSSEFGLAYDDLPFFPRERNVLQIPIHPICLGICLEAARRAGQRAITDDLAAKTVLEHWRQVIAQKYAAREPIFLYGHPNGRLGRFPWLLRELMSEVACLSGVWRTSLAGFEAWWRERAAVEIVAFRNDCGIEISVRGLPLTRRMAVEYFRGDRVAEFELTDQQQTVPHDALAWRTRGRPQLLSSASLTAGQGLKAGLRRYLDWERVTPTEEISTQTWRGWAKRTLRKVRA